MAQKKKPKQGLDKINFFIGKWKTKGEVIAEPNSPAVKIKGADKYKWVSGGAFIQHTVDVYIGKDKVEVTELIGYDTKTKKYSMRAFDNQGNFETMQGKFDKRGNFTIDGNNMRATVTNELKSEKLIILWEKKEKGNIWKKWMSLTLRK